MAFAVDVHFLIAFLTALCALVFSWNELGRRVINAVLGLQILVGLVVLGMHVRAHEGFHHELGWHVAGAVAAAACYGAAGAFGRRAGGARAALAASIAGLLLVGATIVVGLRMFLHG